MIPSGVRSGAQYIPGERWQASSDALLPMQEEGNTHPNVPTTPSSSLQSEAPSMSLSAPIPFILYSHRPPPERCVAWNTLEPNGLLLMSDGRDYCDMCARNMRELFNYRPVLQRTTDVAPTEPDARAS